MTDLNNVEQKATDVANQTYTIWQRVGAWVAVNPKFTVAIAIAAVVIGVFVL